MKRQLINQFTEVINGEDLWADLEADGNNSSEVSNVRTDWRSQQHRAKGGS